MITNDGHCFAYAQKNVRKYVSDSGPRIVVIKYRICFELYIYICMSWNMASLHFHFIPVRITIIIYIHVIIVKNIAYIYSMCVYTFLYVHEYVLM